MMYDTLGAVAACLSMATKRAVEVFDHGAGL